MGKYPSIFISVVIAILKHPNVHCHSGDYNFLCQHPGLKYHHGDHSFICQHPALVTMWPTCLPTFGFTSLSCQRGDSHAHWLINLTDGLNFKLTTFSFMSEAKITTALVALNFDIRINGYFLQYRSTKQGNSLNALAVNTSCSAGLWLDLTDGNRWPKLDQ